MKQIGTVKRIDQYERVYVPRQIMEALGIEKESGHCVWVETEMGFMLKKANVEIEEGVKRNISGLKTKRIRQDNSTESGVKEGNLKKPFSRRLRFADLMSMRKPVMNTTWGG